MEYRRGNEGSFLIKLSRYLGAIRALHQRGRSEATLSLSPKRRGR